MSWVTSGLYEKVIESGLENTPEKYVITTWVSYLFIMQEVHAK